MNRFEYTDSSGDKLAVLPARNGILVEAENAPHVPLDHVEELVAGIRDMARQAGGAAPATSAPVDMAAVYRKLADEQEATAATDVIRRRRSIATARRMFAVELRRMAEGAGA
ncbi:hypothetical protein GT352_28040 [Streptomyces sp. SID1046]|uniref:hypothetical protein n=1 Tax=Streptomyces sp. SID1046 TaxID=2690249 RepID=UPI0013714AD6|nr:hypothetical protein [Streptomyces sp. SID1046]MYV77752.1 hypothetical protein [Streptomyces sp. SID1046]